MLKWAWVRWVKDSHVTRLHEFCGWLLDSRTMPANGLFTSHAWLTTTEHESYCLLFFWFVFLTEHESLKWCQFFSYRVMLMFSSVSFVHLCVCVCLLLLLLLMMMFSWQLTLMKCEKQHKSFGMPQSTWFSYYILWRTLGKFKRLWLLNVCVHGKRVGVG